jgi:uroporphyrinogen decarboxylase
MDNITPRDNLINIFRRRGIRYAPVFFSLCPSLIKKFESIYGKTKAYHQQFNFPMIKVSPPRLPEREVDWNVFYPDGFNNEVSFDDWGVAHEKGSEDARHMTRMHHPMRKFNSLSEFKEFPYPQFQSADYSHLSDEIDELHGRGLAAFYTISDLIWEIAWYLRGMEDLMMDMMVQDDKACYILDKVTEIACVRAEKYAKSGIDILHTGDDIGTQESLMISVDLWRSWIKPRFKKIIRTAKNQNPEIIISYHSCGFIEPFIEDLIEIGVDVLNPVQSECMDFKHIHDKYGDRLSFWGTIGTQTTMPFGSADEVRQEVLKNLDIAGSKGGLLCSPTHLLEPEVPWENIEAYANACMDWRP